MTAAPANDIHELLASEEGFRILTDAMPQMVWSTLPDGFHDYYNAQWYRFTGVPEGSTDGEGWSGMFHADDQPVAWEKWRHSLATGDPYEVEYRLRRHDGGYRWTLGRALPVYRDGRIVRWIGTCTDIHDAKMVAEQNEVLSRELSHRIKNIFAVIAGLVEMTSRSNPDQRPMLRRLVERVISLGRAHNFARPHSEMSRPELPNSQLYGLLVELMAPYQSSDGKRVCITADHIMLDDRGATPIALIVHELATNAAKYGALSVDEGSVTLDARSDGTDVTMVWTETGGPIITGEPPVKGFGSQLISLSGERQLAGTLSHEWKPEGLEVTITVPVLNLYRHHDSYLQAV